MIESSWRSHLELESPAEFYKREWRAAALAAGAYVAIMLLVLLTVDVAFFYPRIETDQLLYLLKAKAFVETGSTQAVNAVNLPPFSYAAMPGVLRAPFMMMFDDFDQQLRGMQLMNVAIVAVSALMAAYILSWALPRRAHSAAIAFAFVFVLLSPDWLANTFVPLADAPYAMLTLSCLIIAVRVLVSARPVSEHKGALLAFAALFMIAFMVRFTAPVLLLPIALLARGRWSSATLTRRQKRILVGVPVAALVILTVLNADAIFGKYITEPFFFLFMASKSGIALNLFASALPAQVIPVFNIGYQVTPPTDTLRPVFGTTPRDLVWMVVGLCISAVAILGMVRSARRFLPEFAYVLAILPVLALMIPSTTRYLMSYQPIIWIAFAVGFAHVTSPIRKRISTGQAKGLAIACGLLAFAGLVAMRSARTARTASSASASSPLKQPLRYRDEVAQTYRSLRTFIESLPADRSLIVSSGGELGRWDVIAGRKNYQPVDSSFIEVVGDRDVYSVLACGTPMSCQYFDGWIVSRSKRLSHLGNFSHTKVFERRTGSARAEVYRISLAAATVAAPGDQSASGLTER